MEPDAYGRYREAKQSYGVGVQVGIDEGLGLKLSSLKDLTRT